MLFWVGATRWRFGSAGRHFGLKILTQQCYRYTEIDRITTREVKVE